jgi:catechol 2,3-dioxygenase-like lactoylglutathione lyase family enzyme
MNLVHIGIVSSSEAAADRFYADLLGLEKTRRSALPAELARPLFGRDEDCEILYYGGGDLVFEVFLSGEPEPSERKISHTCIGVADREALLKRCAELRFEVRDAPKGDSRVVFVADADGNLFEVKQRA